MSNDKTLIFKIISNMLAYIHDLAEEKNAVPDPVLTEEIAMNYTTVICAEENVKTKRIKNNDELTFEQRENLLERLNKIRRARGVHEYTLNDYWS
jgi:hypothetical protein